ncbi:MAG: HipA N-terminal domain-containing protein [Bacteroidales bacterium]|nr:HipA N-terminal domain-containing protein [Bacteroidales bacterium]
MRKAEVYYNDHLAGILTERDDGDYIFRYTGQYVNDHPGKFITFTMPVREKPYTSDRLFPFFEGLIPEGWLLDIASRNWKINQSDRMGLLLACCRDCIGAVSVVPVNIENE